MNLLPLDYWRQEIGYNPWHFWGLADTGVNAIVPVTSNCNDVVYEHSWMAADQLGRNEIRQTIETAELILSKQLGYNVAPQYNTATILWPRYFNQARYRATRMDARGSFIPVPIGEGYVQACGIEARTFIGDGALVWTDEDGDGIDETFTITIATTVTDKKEIAVYFDDSDRLETELSERWRISPLTVVISGGNAVITGKRWLVVRPILYESKANYPIDPTVDANFASTLEVYRRYTKIDGLVSTVDSQAALIWEGKPCACCSSIDFSTDPSSEGWVAGRSGIRDKINGIVIPAEAVYNETTGTWAHPCECTDQCGEPDRVLIRFLAGLDADERGYMQRRMRTIVSRLSCAEMTRKICACDAANREFSNWQFDVSRVEGPETYQANLDSTDSPLGTRRGQIFAWQQIKELAHVTSILF